MPDNRFDKKIKLGIAKFENIVYSISSSAQRAIAKW